MFIKKINKMEKMSNYVENANDLLAKKYADLKVKLLNREIEAFDILEEYNGLGISNSF